MSGEVPKIKPEHFSNELFLRDNIEWVQRYAELRARGVHNLAAFRRVYGAINCDIRADTYERIENLEASDAFNEAFDRILKALPVDQLLSDRKALHSYLDIAHNPNMKEAVRVAALKEACVIAGITSIDDGGRTRKTPTLDDLYRDVMPALEAKAGERPANPLH